MFDYREAAQGVSGVMALFYILTEVMVSRFIHVLKVLDLPIQEGNGAAYEFLK